MVPAVAFGVQVMSMGFLIGAEEALVWRGPMIHGALRQLLTEVAWGELDYLVVDLPPGTGDAQLSVAQLVPLTAGVVVTTPQLLSVSDARRGVAAFQKLGVPVLGIVENMSGEIFGTGGGERAAAELEVPFLGRVPHGRPRLPPGRRAACRRSPSTITSPRPMLCAPSPAASPPASACISSRSNGSGK